MNTEDQNFIDRLILTITNAEEAESVSNEMVGRVFDFLNQCCKEALAYGEVIDTEISNRKVAISGLNQLIMNVSSVATAAQEAARAAQESADMRFSNLSDLIGGNYSQAIESLHEVIDFLEGFRDNEKLAVELMKMQLEIDTNSKTLTAQETINEEQETRLKNLEETTVTALSVDNIDNVLDNGSYYVTLAGDRGYFLIVRTETQNVAGSVMCRSIQYLFDTDGFRFRKAEYVSTDTPEWGEWEQAGQKGVGNLINITELVPPANGFYDLTAAIEAVPASYRSLGRWITYRLGTGDWETKQFVGSTLTQWENPDLWEDAGGKGSITNLKINGESVTPDPDGSVNIIIDVPEVDSTLDEASTNPVQNNVITQKVLDLEAKTVADIDISLNEDQTEAHISILNSKREEIAGGDIPVGTGSGDASTAKIVLSAYVDNPVVREGASSKLFISYDYQYIGGDMGGESTGERGDIEVTVKSGAITTFSTTFSNVAPGQLDPIDLAEYLRSGSTDVVVRASVTDPETGALRTRQITLQVKSVSLSLSSSYSLASSIAGGGYDPYSTVVMPFAVSGSGTKTVSLYLDGDLFDSKVITKSGKTNGSFSIPMTGLSTGRHNVQMLAELEASADLTLYSESIYIDILKKDASGTVSEPFIGAMIVFDDGRLCHGESWKQPTISVGQYERLTFDFVVYNPERTPAELKVFHGDDLSYLIAAPRTVQQYSNRFTEWGEQDMSFRSGETIYPFTVDVVESDIDIEEVSDSLLVRLSPAGRSNSEENPAEWSYGDVTTKFSGFDWSSNGWTGDALLLTNGAAIEIRHTPFATDATSLGLTVEAELTCSNASDRDGVVMSCMNRMVGFEMTTEEASFHLSDTQSLDTKFASEIPIKIAFVVERKAENRLVHLFVNGIRDRSLQYQSNTSLMHDEPSTIRISSESADVELRNIRIYSRALTADEILSNYMVDRPSAEDMIVLFNKNNVLNEETDEIDIEKLRGQGKGVMRIVGDVELVTQTNNKKFEVPVDVYFYSPYGKEYDFIARNIGLRIQGTSSTTYPRKNWRLYFDRPANGCTLEVNGVLMPDMLYSFKPGARPVPIFCLKADFSDSSSTHNTGAVRIINDIFKRCGWLTPPQKAYTGEYDLRIGVDGFPINLFYDNDGTGAAKFLGKYNFNNEKSESGIVFGFEGIEGFNDEAALDGSRNKCICLEFLNNSAGLCLFSTAEMTNFDEELEFRFKEDTTWADADPEDKAAVIRLWSWILDCKGNPEKFLAEYSEYFGNDAPFAWYIMTNYFMAVDNRAKNMMFATWDGKIWYIIPYDMDTLFGLRNDSYLKFDYTIDFDTVDESQGGAYCFAGHDSVLWELVRGCPQKLAEVARSIRSVMSTDYVLDMFNNQLMSEWSERIYNKDGEFKYIDPLLEQGRDYLYALQGSRCAHRTYTIINRFSLLDSIYCAGTYRDDAFPIYLSYQFASDNRDLRLTAAERYCFGYGMTNGDPTVSGLMAENRGDEISMTFKQNLIVNDPQNIYGASRVLTLDLTELSHAVVGTLNLNTCTHLTELDASCAAGQEILTNLVVDGCRNLQILDINGLKGIASLDLSQNKQLKALHAADTALTNVAFADGGMLSQIELPASIRTLELRHLSRLRMENISFPGTPQINRLVVDNCEGLDWRELLAICPETTYLRVTGINETGRGEMLRQFSSMRGVDENGNNVNTCRLVGDYQLTAYLDETEYAELCAHFPELNIKQPEWTVIKFDETVADPQNVSNMDNETGYEFDNEYKPSAHVSNILANRHRVLAKYTDVGEMTICPLDDNDGRYYHDGTEANLQGPLHPSKDDEGDVMMHEPDRWCKGIDDFINKCHYHCYSSLEQVSEIPGRKMYESDLELIDRTALRVSPIYKTLDESRIDFDDYRVFIGPVKGYKQVRWQAVSSTIYGALFLDEDNNIISSAAASAARMTTDSYLFCKIPEGAVKIAFTVLRNVPCTFLWMTTSEEVHAIEPDPWTTGEYLEGVYKARYENNQLRSISGVSPTVSLSQAAFSMYAKQRGDGFSLIDYPMHRDLACLFFAAYGNRDSSKVCGYGATQGSASGATNQFGMRDTISNPANAIGSSYGWYYDSLGVIRSINAINALGIENLWGNVAEWCDGIDVQKTSWSTSEHDGEHARTIISSPRNESWIVEFFNGRFMDMIPIVTQGTETTHYCDKVAWSNSADRAFARSYFNFVSSSGVSCAWTAYDVADARSWAGSRLAFRGKIVKTLHVPTFLAAKAIG